MPDTQNRNEDVFAKYNAMSTEELQQILREDASKPEGQEETSTEALFYIMEVLAQRRRARNEGKTPEEALEEFQKYYEEDDVSSQTEREPVVIRKKNSAAPNWIKRLVAAAAIVVLIFSGTLTAKAFGFDLWEVIVKWTQETFHFGYVSGGDSTDEDPKEEADIVYAGLQEMLDRYNITTELVPSWIPEGYIEESIKNVDTPKQRQYVAKYKCSDKVIKIWIADYLGEYPSQIEQSESTLEVYESGGVKYYLFEDVDQIRAAWIRDSFECYISGPLTIEEMKQMIDSIEKG